MDCPGDERMSTEENVMQPRCTPSTFRTYHLPDVLYSSQRLILNPHDRIVTLMDDNGMSAQGWAVTLAGYRAQLALFNLGIQPVPVEDGYRLFRLTPV